MDATTSHRATTTNDRANLATQLTTVATILGLHPPADAPSNHVDALFYTNKYAHKRDDDAPARD